MILLNPKKRTLWFIAETVKYIEEELAGVDEKRISFRRYNELISAAMLSNKNNENIVPRFSYGEITRMTLDILSENWAINSNFAYRYGYKFWRKSDTSKG